MSGSLRSRRKGLRGSDYLSSGRFAPSVRCSRCIRLPRMSLSRRPVANMPWVKKGSRISLIQAHSTAPAPRNQQMVARQFPCRPRQHRQRLMVSAAVIGGHVANQLMPTRTRVIGGWAGAPSALAHSRMITQL